MSLNESSSRTLKTADMTCQIFTALRDLDGARLTELANYLDMSKSGLHHYLSTLHQNQFVVKRDDEYHLSSKFLLMGEYVRQRPDLYQIGRQEIQNLAEETGEFAHLMAEEFGLGIHLYKARGTEGAAAEFYRQKEQRPDYLHISAAGKALLAHLDRERVESIIDEYGLVAKTEKTITDPATLFEEIETIRERGYALNNEEEVRGTRAVGAAVLNSDGSPVGALSVSGPTSRISDERFHNTLPKDVTRAANMIENTLENHER
jgi:DNA-binding IclR family transcriptional regulator